MQIEHSAFPEPASDIRGYLPRSGSNTRQSAFNGDTPVQQVPANAGTASASITASTPMEELVNAGRRKDEFLALISHEIRSPLSSIKNAVDVLRRQDGADVAARHRMYAIIDRQIRNVTLIVADLLDVSRINRGQLRLRREPIDLRDVLHNALETLDPELRLGGQQLTATWTDSPIRVLADACRLEQVFVNLLANASKYSDRGDELALSVETGNEFVSVHIVDSGIGISADALPHIFDLFEQADAGAPRSRSGLGIGLTVVRTIVNMHAGSVTAKSAGLGKGSEFIVRLPLLR